MTQNQLLNFKCFIIIFGTSIAPSRISKFLTLKSQFTENEAQTGKGAQVSQRQSWEPELRSPGLQSCATRPDTRTSFPIFAKIKSIPDFALLYFQTSKVNLSLNLETLVNSHANTKEEKHISIVTLHHICRIKYLQDIRDMR